MNLLEFSMETSAGETRAATAFIHFSVHVPRAVCSASMEDGSTKRDPAKEIVRGSRPAKKPYAPAARLMCAHATEKDTACACNDFRLEVLLRVYVRVWVWACVYICVCMCVCVRLRKWVWAWCGCGCWGGSGRG